MVSSQPGLEQVHFSGDGSITSRKGTGGLFRGLCIGGVCVCVRLNGIQLRHGYSAVGMLGTGPSSTEQSQYTLRAGN